MLQTLNRDVLDLRYDLERTIVLIPSISFSRLTSTYLLGRNFFEERNLFYLACLSNPGTRFVAVVSDIIEPCYVDYCIEHVCAAYGLEAEDIRRRFEMIRVPLSGDESLSAALNAQPDRLTALRAKLAGYPAPILDFWLVSQLEVTLAKTLDLPYVGLPATLLDFDSKSKSRELFRATGVRLPAGRENIETLEAAWLGLRELKQISNAETFLIKLNAEEGGNGIAEVPRTAIDLPYGAFLNHIAASKKIPREAFIAAFPAQGATIEEFVTAEIARWPSVKMEILPDGEVRNLATHDQVLKEVMYIGCQFPADDGYRADIIRLGRAIAELASRRGVRGLLSVDFLATKEHAADLWTLCGIEINTRKGATTHPYYWTRWLTDATYDEDTGELSARTGSIIYKASEFFSSHGLNRIPPRAILDAVKLADLDYHPRRQSGVFVHMLSCVTKFSKIGATVIGHDQAEVESYWNQLEALVETLADLHTAPAQPQAKASGSPGWVLTETARSS